MRIPGVHIETIAPPQTYTLPQLEHAVAMAELLQRGKLVLCVQPAGSPA